MDYQSFVEHCVSPCAVISVEITEDSRRGDMRIECGNQPFRELMGPAFHDGISCSELAPPEANFEDLCVRSAILGQRVHAYVHNRAQTQWMDVTLFPLVRDGGDHAYCLFFIGISDNPDPEGITSVSMDTAAAALKASVALLSSDDLKVSVKQVLDDVLVRTGGFSARLTIADDERKVASDVCQTFVKGFFADDDMADVIVPYETVASWQKMLGSGNAVIVESEADLETLEPYNPEWVATLRMYGVSSFIIMALRQRGDTIGYLQLSNFDVGRIAEIKELLELITFLLSAQISNHLLMQRLERMGKLDGLTNLQNRHAMTQRIDEFSNKASGEPFGTVVVDLNGLKTVNDNDGHEAGDRMLLQAADLLKSVFRKEDLYRIGGDEFVAIAVGVERDLFERKVERLREGVKEGNQVSFAIGSSWSDGSLDMRTAFLQADDFMYADKKSYYDTNPDLIRR